MSSYLEARIGRPLSHFCGRDVYVNFAGHPHDPRQNLENLKKNLGRPGPEKKISYRSGTKNPPEGV
jgi:hypothetical protein